MKVVILEISALEEVFGKAYPFVSAFVGTLVVIGAILLAFSLLNLYTIASEMKKIRMLFEDVMVADDENVSNLKLNMGNQSANDSDNRIEEGLNQLIIDYNKKLSETENEELRAEIISTIDALNRITGSR